MRGASRSIEFTVDQIVPWGRNLAEYRRMFALTEDDLSRKILGCGDGPASVNAELHPRGSTYVSIDPIYQYPAYDIAERIAATAPVIAEQLEKNKADYCWDFYQSPEQLVQTRRAAMNTFLEDFRLPDSTERYITGALPNLPFADDAFDLILCSHLLFTYSEQLDEAFHQQAILEMFRVGQEVRIFPLLETNGRPSRHGARVMNFLKAQNIISEVNFVNYEFQKGSKGA